MPARAHIQPGRFPPSLELPIGDRDLTLRLPAARSSFLPDIYRAFNHPLHTSHGMAYYFIQNGSPGSMQEVYTYEDSQKAFPQGPEEDTLQQGEQY